MCFQFLQLNNMLYVLKSKLDIFGGCLNWNRIYLIQHPEVGRCLEAVSTFSYIPLCQDCASPGVHSFLKSCSYTKVSSGNCYCKKVEWTVWRAWSVKKKTDFVLRTTKIWYRFCLLNVNDKNKIKLSNYHCFICFISFIWIINEVAPG